MTKRETLQIVELDIDYCELRYGNAPCAAALGATGEAKCFNTFKTCQDQANFQRGSLTLRFGPNQGGLPFGETVFPVLKSVSTKPIKVNISAVDGDLAPTGRGERVTINLYDFVDSDAVTDVYRDERISGAALQAGVGYVPRDRGTFFSRFKVRNPFYYGRPLRVLNGFVGQPLSEMEVRAYIVEEISGPGVKGDVKIVALDVLALAGRQSALCPRPAAGVVRDDVTVDDTVFFLDPPGIGESYPSAGTANVGGQIFRFTRVGDQITIVEP